MENNNDGMETESFYYEDIVDGINMLLTKGTLAFFSEAGISKEEIMNRVEENLPPIYDQETLDAYCKRFLQFVLIEQLNKNFAENIDQKARLNKVQIDGEKSHIETDILRKFLEAYESGDYVGIYNIISKTSAILTLVAKNKAKPHYMDKTQLKVYQKYIIDNRKKLLNELSRISIPQPVYEEINSNEEVFEPDVEIDEGIEEISDSSEVLGENDVTNFEEDLPGLDEEELEDTLSDFEDEDSEEIEDTLSEFDEENSEEGLEDTLPDFEDEDSIEENDLEDLSELDEEEISEDDDEKYELEPDEEYVVEKDEEDVFESDEEIDTNSILSSIDELDDIQTSKNNNIETEDVLDEDDLEDTLPGFEEDSEEELEDTLPGFEDEDSEEDLPGLDEEEPEKISEETDIEDDFEDTLPGFEDEDSEEEIEDALPGFEDEDSEELEDTLPGFEDEESVEENELEEDLPGLDEEEQEEISEKTDIEDDFEDTLPGFEDEDSEEELEDTLPGIEDEDSVEENELEEDLLGLDEEEQEEILEETDIEDDFEDTLPGFEDEDSEELEDTLPVFEDEDSEEELEDALPGFEEDSEELEDTLPGFEDEESVEENELEEDLPGLDEEEQEEISEETDIEDNFEDTLPGFEEDSEEGLEDTLPGFEEEDSKEELEDALPGFEEEDSKEEIEDTLPGFEDEDNVEENELEEDLPGLDEEEQEEILEETDIEDDFEDEDSIEDEKESQIIDERRKYDLAFEDNYYEIPDISKEYLEAHPDYNNSKFVEATSGTSLDDFISTMLYLKDTENVEIVGIFNNIPLHTYMLNTVDEIENLYDKLAEGLEDAGTLKSKSECISYDEYYNQYIQKDFSKYAAEYQQEHKEIKMMLIPNNNATLDEFVEAALYFIQDDMTGTALTYDSITIIASDYKDGEEIIKALSKTENTEENSQELENEESIEEKENQEISNENEKDISEEDEVEIFDKSPEYYKSIAKISKNKTDAYRQRHPECKKVMIVVERDMQTVEDFFEAVRYYNSVNKNIIAQYDGIQLIARNYNSAKEMIEAYKSKKSKKMK